MSLKRDERYAEIDWVEGIVDSQKPPESAVNVGLSDKKRQQLRAKARARYLSSAPGTSFWARLKRVFGF